MLLITATSGDISLTGTLFEPGDEAPEYPNSPSVDAPYTWVCDEFYEVESGGVMQQIEGREIRIAFEPPTPRGFEKKEKAIEAAKSHVSTQLARIGLHPKDVSVEVKEK